MSDTYDQVERFVEKTQREGGAQGIKHSDDESHPQQDMGKFADVAERMLKPNSPETPGGDPFCTCEGD